MNKEKICSLSSLAVTMWMTIYFSVLISVLQGCSGPELTVCFDGSLETLYFLNPMFISAAVWNQNLPDYSLYEKMGPYLLKQCTQIRESIYCRMVEL